jgi:uncharacterized cupredoxin-like copper-binding protein
MLSRPTRCGRRRLGALAAGAALVLGACSSGGSTAAPPPDANLVIEAHDIRFDKKAYTAQPGAVKIAYVSKANQTHTLVVLDAQKHEIGDKLRVVPGKVVGGTYDLPAGSYRLVCDIPGHEAAGMWADLTVGTG